MLNFHWKNFLFRRKDPLKVNENRLWFCDICDKTNITYRRLRHIDSKPHKHKKASGTAVKKYKFF